MSIDENREITKWIRQLFDGSDDASRQIWDHYYDRLVRFARRKLAAHPRRAADEEDVVVDAMDSFFRGVENRKFEQLENNEDVWRLLLTITARKAKKRIRSNLSLKRGGGAVRGESVFQSPSPGLDDSGGLDQLLIARPAGEFADSIVNRCREMFDKLGDDSLITVAQMKMEGFTNSEIADQLQITERSVERKLNRIRQIWSET